MTATLPTNAYAPGQAISVHLIVNNQTDRNINEFNIDLVKIVQYFDAIQKNQKKIKKLLVSTLIDGCGAKSTADFSSEIIVPPVPSTDITSSNVLHVSYELKVRNCISSFTRQLAVITFHIDHAFISVFNQILMIID